MSFFGISKIRNISNSIGLRLVKNMEPHTYVLHVERISQEEHLMPSIQQYLAFSQSETQCHTYIDRFPNYCF